MDFRNYRVNSRRTRSQDHDSSEMVRASSRPAALYDARIGSASNFFPWSARKPAGASAAAPCQPPKKSVRMRPSLEFLQLSRGWLLAPVTEYRTGFPYARVDERQNYAGVPNAWRFPNFFSQDLRVAKSLTAGKDHAVQFSFSVFNLTNHWNPEAVRWNTADAQVGEFLGQRPRRFRVDFDLLF